MVKAEGLQIVSACWLVSSWLSILQPLWLNNAEVIHYHLTQFVTVLTMRTTGDLSWTLVCPLSFSLSYLIGFFSFRYLIWDCSLLHLPSHCSLHICLLSALPVVGIPYHRLHHDSTLPIDGFLCSYSTLCFTLPIDRAPCSCSPSCFTLPVVRFFVLIASPFIPCTTCISTALYFAVYSPSSVTCIPYLISWLYTALLVSCFTIRLCCSAASLALRSPLFWPLLCHNRVCDRGLNCDCDVVRLIQ